MLEIVAIIAFLLGVLADHWLEHRWIDHRWYCGHRHPANHPCKPTPEKLKDWKRTEDRFNRAEELEDEAKRLRRYG